MKHLETKRTIILAAAVACLGGWAGFAVNAENAVEKKRGEMELEFYPIEKALAVIPPIRES
jgi:hypothetical protein